MFFSCDDIHYKKLPNSAEVVTLTSFETYRLLLQEEKEILPDFRCVNIEVDIEVQDLPDARWVSVKAPRFGSKLAKSGGELFYRINEFPATFRTCGPNSSAVSKRLFATQMPLLDTSPYDHTFIPSAAVAWSFSDDKKTVYYKLNENMRWSDGSICNADDFIFAYEFFTSKNIVDPWVNESFEDISIKKIDDFCIAVMYEEGDRVSPTELLSITNMRPVCKKFYNGIIPENWVYTYNLQAEPTTGPYYLDSYNQNEGLSFVKMENWWGYEYEHYAGMANFDKIHYFVVLGAEKEGLKHFKAGKFDLAELAGSASYIASLNDDCVTDGYVTPWRTTYEPLVGMYGFFFNTLDKTLSEHTVRQAIFYALDIDGIGKTLYSPDYQRLTTLGAGQVFDGYEFNNKEIPVIPFNLEKANTLLDNSSFSTFSSDGIRKNSKNQKLSIEILYSESLSRQILGLLSEQAKKAGIELTFRYLKNGALEKINERNFQIYFGHIGNQQIPNHYYNFHSSFANSFGINNITGLDNKELDKMLEEYRDWSGDFAHLASLNQKIEQVVMEQFVFLPYYYTNVSSFLTWKWICFPAWIGHRHDPQFMRSLFSYAWFDQEIYDEVIQARTHNNRIPAYAFDYEW